MIFLSKFSKSYRILKYEIILHREKHLAVCTPASFLYHSGWPAAPWPTGESKLCQKEEPSGKAKETVLGVQSEDRESPYMGEKRVPDVII